MKLRIKFQGLSRFVLIEDCEDNIDIRNLMTRVSQCFADVLKGPFFLSLNKKDKIGESEMKLKELGVVSGDLLHIVRVDEDGNLVKENLSIDLTSDRPLGLPCREATTTVSVQQPGCSKDFPTKDSQNEMPEQSEKSEAEMLENDSAVDPFVVIQYLKEPRLCCDSVNGQMPAVLSELYSECRCQSSEEALCLVLHVLMIEAGYQSVSEISSQGLPTEQSNYPSKAWRQRAPAFFTLHYCHPSSDSVTYTLTCVPMGQTVIVHGQAQVEETLPKCKCSFSTKEFVRELTADSKDCYQNLRKLSRLFKDQIALPLLQKYREAMNLVPLFGILSLSHELKLKILSHLDVQSLINVSKVCKAFNSLSNDRYIWRRLYLSQFGNRGDNRLNQDWKELYKTELTLRRQRRKMMSQMTMVVPPFIPADPYTQRVPPLAPFGPGIIGGDYDLNPQFHGIPNPIFGRRGQIPPMRPRFDPFAPDQNFQPGRGGGFRDGHFGRGLRGRGNGGFSGAFGGPPFF